MRFTAEPLRIGIAVWCLVCFAILAAPLRAQPPGYPSASFGPPLDIPLYLSGNFAELRNNHFHAGIDLKTQGVEGKNVLAAEEGFIARINISPWGYGHALYVEHPNGYTTVYGHLKALSPRIEEVLRQKQYEESSFSVDFAPAQQIKVQKGEIIGLSGNTGSSGGPHLHFEIRDTETQRPLNPLLFGFDITDNIPPRIRGVRVHPLSDTTLINGSAEPKSFVVLGSAGSYHLKAGTRIEVYGAFGLSLHTLDFLDGYPNPCGIYTLDLQVDSQTVCRQVFDELDFSTQRHINAYRAHDVHVTNRWHYHKSFVLPGNKLDVYRPRPADGGVIHFDDDGIHPVVYTATDAYGNTSTLTFDLHSLSTPNGPMPTPEPYEAYFTWNQDNDYSYEREFTLHIPAGGLYEDLRFTFNWQRGDKNTFTPYYTAHNELTPLQESAILTFNVTHVPARLRSKLVLARFNAKGHASYSTGKIIGDTFEATSRVFGKFTVMADTVPPTIAPASTAKPGPGSRISFRASDDRTGIAEFNAYLNDRWVLAEYDPKTATITVIPDRIPGGEALHLRLVLKDGVGNSTEWSRTWSP